MGVLRGGFAREKVSLVKIFGCQWPSTNRKPSAFVLPGGKVFVFTGILPIVENEGKFSGRKVSSAHRSLTECC